MIGSRIIVLSVFIHHFKWKCCFLFVSHWIIMLIYILNLKTKMFQTKFDEILFDMILACLYIFCYLNVVNYGSNKHRMITFYAYMLIENLIIIILWLNQNKLSTLMMTVCLVGHYALFFGGLISVVSLKLAQL